MFGKKKPSSRKEGDRRVTKGGSNDSYPPHPVTSSSSKHMNQILSVDRVSFLNEDISVLTENSRSKNFANSRPPIRSSHLTSKSQPPLVQQQASLPPPLPPSQPGHRRVASVDRVQSCRQNSNQQPTNQNHRPQPLQQAASPAASWSRSSSPSGSCHSAPPHPLSKISVLSPEHEAKPSLSSQSSKSKRSSTLWDLDTDTPFDESESIGSNNDDDEEEEKLPSTPPRSESSKIASRYVSHSPTQSISSVPTNMTISTTSTSSTNSEPTKQSNTHTTMTPARHFEAGKAHLLARNDKDAIIAFRTAVHMNRIVLGEDSPQVGKMLLDIGDLYRLKRGHFRKALKFYFTACDLWKIKVYSGYDANGKKDNKAGVRVAGERSFNVACLLNRLGSVFFERAELDKAKHCFLESIKIQDELLEFGGEYAAVVASRRKCVLTRTDAMCGLGSVNGVLGNYDRAMKYLESALEMYRRHFGGTVDIDECNERAVKVCGNGAECEEDQAIIATIIFYIGIVSGQRGDFHESMAKFKDALTIRKQVLPENHSDIGQSLSRMGVLVWKQGKILEAMDMLREALRIQKASLGPDHIDVARTLNNIGVSCSEDSNYQEAIPLFMEAKRITEMTVRNSHPFVGDVLVNMGNAHSKLVDHYDKAMECYFEALKVYRFNRFAENHPSILRTLDIITKTQIMEDCTC